MTLLKDVQGHSKEISERLENVQQWPTTRELMRMTPKERKPLLQASVDCALPRCMADLSRREMNGN